MEPNIDTEEKKKMFQVPGTVIDSGYNLPRRSNRRAIFISCTINLMAQIFKKSFKAGDSYREKQLGLISTSKVEIKWHEIPVFLVFCVSYNGVVIE